MDKERVNRVAYWYFIGVLTLNLCLFLAFGVKTQMEAWQENNEQPAAHRPLAPDTLERVPLAKNPNPVK
jgi:uncharacterized membrane protein YhaH (DUF805 family)